MYVFNEVDGSTGWYTPSEDSPPLGNCGDQSDPITAVSGFTLYGVVDALALLGLTMCPNHFIKPLLLDLGTPVVDGGIAEVHRFLNTSDLTNLHELMHLVSLGSTWKKGPVLVQSHGQSYVNPYTDGLSLRSYHRPCLSQTALNSWVVN